MKGRALLWAWLFIFPASAILYMLKAGIMPCQFLGGYAMSAKAKRINARLVQVGVVVVLGLIGVAALHAMHFF